MKGKKIKTIATLTIFLFRKKLIIYHKSEIFLICSKKL